MEKEYTKRIEYLVKPFIEFGLYDSPERLLRDLIKVLTREKMKAYERAVRRFENKHKMSFEEYTEKLEEKATPELERIRWSRKRPLTCTTPGRKLLKRLV